MAVFGGIWRYLAVFGGIWRYLAVFGGIGRYWAVFGGICGTNSNYPPSVNEHAGTRLFQESFLSTGIYPTISLSTHEMPNCNASCIDNILTNNTANVTLSATIKDSVSHHLPIVCLSISEQFATISGNKLPSTNTFSRYNFNQSNTAVMLSNTLVLSDHHLNNTLQPDFDGLVSAFTDIVNNACKEEITTKSKRNPVDNPWITQGIIISVNKKHSLYKSWQKTIKNKKDPDDQGDPEHHNRYILTIVNS